MRENEEGIAMGTEEQDREAREAFAKEQADTKKLREESGQVPGLTSEDVAAFEAKQAAPAPAPKKEPTQK